MPDWITPDIARSLRLQTLHDAAGYRAEYRRERMGFQRRLMRQLLGYAAEYRRIEHNQQHEQRAA